MNNTPPRFNAPIPEYADLNFLFYRWGYDRIEDNGFKLFLRTFMHYFYEDGLKVFLRGSSWQVIHFPEGSPSKIIAKGTGWTKPEIEKAGGTFVKDTHCLELADVFILKNGKAIIFPMKKGSFAYFFEGKYRKNGGITWVDTEDESIKYQRVLQPLVDFWELTLSRKHLQAFEQKTGFYNHGLTPEQVEEYAPTPTQEEALELNKRRDRNQKQAKESELKRNTLENVYEDVKHQNPRAGQTDLSRALAERVSEDTGLQCSASFALTWMKENDK